MNDLLQKIEAAIAETERIARSALRNPARYDAKLGDYVDIGVDDGEWVASGCMVEPANPGRGDVFQGGITIYDEGGHTEEQATHIALNDPKRVLRRVARDRKLLEEHKPRDVESIPYTECVTCHGSYVSWPCATVVLLAEDYEIEVSRPWMI